MWYKILEKEKRRCGKTNRTYCFVECQLCHSTKWVREDTLKNKKVVSCGCYNKTHNYFKELKAGETNNYGMKIIKKLRKDEDENGYIWQAQCQCGNLFEVSTNRFHERKSCGCLASENGKTNIGKVHKKYYKDNTSILQVAKEGTISTNTSGVTGVTYDKARSKWMASIEFKRERYFLGRYIEKEDAIFARKEAEKYLFGEFIEWYSENYPEQWERINRKRKDD